MKIFEQRFPSSTTGGRDAIEFRVERVGQLLSLGIIAGARCAKNCAGGVAQFLPEMFDEKFPARSPALAAPASQSQILQVQRLQISLGFGGASSYTAVSFLRAAPQGLGKAIAGEAPPRALRLRMQPFDQVCMLFGKSVGRRECGFLCHAVRTAFGRPTAS